MIRANVKPSIAARCGAALAGLRLTDGVLPAGQRLASARGALQIFTSALTGTGLAAYICLLLPADGGPQWSWSIWLGCVLATLLFDACFNAVLNLVGGGWFALLIALRIALTLDLAQFSGEMLLLTLNHKPVAEQAKLIAEKEFDASLTSLVTAANGAQTVWLSRQSALTTFAVQASTTPSASVPDVCSQSVPNLSDDPATRAMQRRAESQRLASCANASRQQQTRAQLQADALDTAAKQLQAASESAKAASKEADDALKNKKATREASVAAVATGIPKMTEALGSFMDNNRHVRLQFWGLLSLILMVECAALMAKIGSLAIDQAALAERAELLEESVLLHADIRASLLTLKALRQQARTCTMRTVAADHAEKDLRDAMATHVATHAAHRATRRMSAPLDEAAMPF